MAPASGAAAPSGYATRALEVAGEYQKRLLDPVDRFSEIVFGLIMVLAFTGSQSVGANGQQEVRQMLHAALASNVAWGLVDGVMQVATSFAGCAQRTRPSGNPRCRPDIKVADLRGAVGSCLLVVLATFPPTIPFLLVDSARAGS